MRDKLRTVRLSPYAKGKGPTFTLTMWDTGRLDYKGQSYIAYDLRLHEDGKTTVLFTGEDFSPAPSLSIDGDGAVSALLSYLTLRPGDTDSDLFYDYTPAQMEFAEQHAEALDLERMGRFGDDD